MGYTLTPSMWPMGEIGYVVTHAGNRYIVAVEMAEIFARKRDRLIAAGLGELVPLPHAAGVDILWVDERVPCEITPITVPEGDDAEAARVRWGLCRRSRRDGGSAQQRPADEQHRDNRTGKEVEPQETLPPAVR